MPLPKKDEGLQRETIPSTGTKYDDGKLRMDLIPSQMIEGLAKVFTDGAKKYEDRNWEKGIKYTKLYAAILRHLLAWFRREDNDVEFNRSHLWNAMWGCGALAFYSLFPIKYMKFDDRPYHTDGVGSETWADEPLREGEAWLGKTVKGTAQYDPAGEDTHSCMGWIVKGRAEDCKHHLPSTERPVTTEHECWGGWSDGPAVHCLRTTRQRDNSKTGRDPHYVT